MTKRKPFPVPKGWKFDVKGAIKIAKEIAGLKEPIAWACRTCNKIDWADTKEQLAKPEHVSYRGVDIGSCNGKMIPLYGK